MRVILILIGLAIVCLPLEIPVFIAFNVGWGSHTKTIPDEFFYPKISPSEMNITK